MKTAFIETQLMHNLKYFTENNNKIKLGEMITSRKSEKNKEKC
jgi:hypothetical protein